MRILKEDMKRLDNIANMYHKTSGHERDVEKKMVRFSKNNRRKIK